MALLQKTGAFSLAVALCIAGRPVLAQQDPKAIVQLAVDAELAANRNDHTHWRYLNHRGDADNSIDVVVETQDGAIRKCIEQNGKPVSAGTSKTEDGRIQAFIHDPDAQKKQRRDGMHDDKSAEELLHLFTTAFVWKIDKETAETITLSFVPDPNFHPPDMEARVMGEMSGTLVVDRGQHRIRTMKGTLGEDVTIGFGILGRLKKGGTFNVERRQVLPGLWQITEEHVHIDGRALLFKTIGQQQDDVKTRFTLVPPGTTLEQAFTMLTEPR
jgi:hypothetical protein